MAKVNFLVEISEVCGHNLLQDPFVYTCNGLGTTLCVVCTWRAAHFSGRNVLGYTATVWRLLISALQVVIGKSFVGQRGGGLMKKLKKIKIVGLKEILVKYNRYTSKKREQMSKEPMCCWVWRLELCARYFSVLTHALGGDQLLVLSTNPETGGEELPLTRSAHHLTSVFTAAHLSTPPPLCSLLHTALPPLRKDSLLARLLGG